MLGPLAGGVLVDHASWRWVFHINLPVGLVALPGTSASARRHQRVSHLVDYLGAILIALAATSLVLMTSLGTTYAWGSAPTVILGVAGLLLIVLLVAVEQRAAEPILPLSLFSNRVFSISAAMSFVVGFAMFGAIIFLPLYLQVVKGVKPTISGVRLLPLLIGVLLTSVGSGQLISRTGRYKIFPIIGTALMTVGLGCSRPRPPHQYRGQLGLYVRVRARAGLGDAGADHRRPELGRLRGPRRRHLGSDVLSLHGRLVWHGGLRFDLLQQPGLEHRPLPAGGDAAGRGSGVDAEPGAPEPTPPDGPHRLHRRLRQIVADCVPRGGADRRLCLLLAWLLPEVRLRKTVAATDRARHMACRPNAPRWQRRLERAVGSWPSGRTG